MPRDPGRNSRPAGFASVVRLRRARCVRRRQRQPHPLACGERGPAPESNRLNVQGRVTREVRADNTTDTLYTYDLAGRLKTVTDPKDQVTTHSYNLDDSLSGYTL